MTNKNNDEMIMMKRLSALAPAITLIAMGIAIVSGVYAVQVTAEHNDSSKSHPDIIRAIDAVKAQTALLEQKITLSQAANDAAHKRQERAQERILNAIDRLDEKIP